MTTKRAMSVAAFLLLAEAAVPNPAQAAAASRTFALIVTNNRSIALGRPDLQYADDDGAKYYELFRMIAPAEDVSLFTELDRDTERLFPSLGAVARPPRKQAIEAAAARIARDADAARRAGQSVDFYFIYAGHGDVAEGRGFIELGDAPFFSEDLEALLSKIPATRSHVVLDSCNSFFVINARKPGGRRFATPEDAARSLGRRLPNVGIFLSTSAEADVFEWSELQSGIFSHAVRSGIAGAADANGDGAVSYEELQAFVDTSAAGVRNPTYRPKVYARGPGGKNAEPLFSPALARAAVLRIEPAKKVRLTVRDGDDLPWVDVFKEEGVALAIRLPTPRLAHASVEELEVTDAGAHVVRRYNFQDAGDQHAVAFATLALADTRHVPRGPGELFRMLFTRPFGPKALALYQATNAAQPAPVFGISRDDTERMSLLLTHIGDMEHRNRMMGATGLLGVGALTLGAGVWVLREDFGSSRKTMHAVGYSLAAVGVGTMVMGGVAFLLRSPAEKLHDDFVAGMRQGGDPALIVAKTEKDLDEIAKDYRFTRAFLRWTGIGLAATAAGAFAFNELGNNTSKGNRFFYGLLGMTGAWVAVSSYYEYPIEQMVRLWGTDPGIRQLPRVTVSPLGGGAMLGMTGAF